MTSQLPPALAAFQDALRKFTVNPAFHGGRPYVRAHDLTKWMATTPKDHSYPNAGLLIEEVYREHIGGRVEPPITHTSICRQGGSGCAIAFSILLELGKGELIHWVQQKDIIDRHLPMALTTLKGKFSEIDTSSGPKWAESFHKEQFKYYPVPFELEMDKDYSGEPYILPVCRKQEIGRGGQARVFSILVQAVHVSKDLADRLPREGHTRFEDDDFGDCFQFALKSYEPEHNHYFHHEKAAFDALKRNKGIIRYLGCFIHTEVRKSMAALGGVREDTRVQTRHILLEYGRFDLMKIFITRLPPVLSEEIKSFWAALVQVADALEGIHNIKTRNGEYHGWHNDIKPGNIIVVDGEYKLADPGFAKFQKRLETDGDSIPKIAAGGMTQSYAAPECLAHIQGQDIQVDQTVDIWSMGCVLSMAATWVTLGFQGVHQYTKVRQIAIESLAKKAKRDPSRRKLTPGDYFHDGEKILPEVKEWHAYLRTITRRTDQITGNILDFIEGHMLVPCKRMSAAELYESLLKIVQDGPDAEFTQQMKSLTTILLAIDEEASMNPESILSQQPNATTVAQGARLKPKIDDIEVPLLLKTASRYEVMSRLPGPRIAAETQVPIPEKHDEQLENYGLPSPGQNRRSLEAPAAHMKEPPFEADRLSRRTSMLGKMRDQSSNGPEPQNVIQAREQFGDDSWIQKKFGKKEDQILKAYFDNRDIVFLVDNASSMEPFWDEATYLLETLFLKTRPFDDKMDLHFTLSPKSFLEEEKKVEAFRKKMGEMRPRKDSRMTTDMVEPIERIFAKFFDKKKKKTKDGITLIVLTDGKWEAMENSNDVYEYVKNLLKELHRRGLTGQRKRPASIQFIQFGEDIEATERMRALDDDLEIENYKDIIDHEMFSVSGNVRKMLVGSFVSSWDKLDAELSLTRSNTMASTSSYPSSHRLSMPPQTQSSPGTTNQLETIVELPTHTLHRAQASSTGSSGSAYAETSQPKYKRFLPRFSLK